MKTSKYWISKLALIKHPEGGYYKEIYRNPVQVQVQGIQQSKNAATSIYYLLEYGDQSHFHQLRSDEIWYYHIGNSLTVCMFDKNGHYTEKKLGPSPDMDEYLQLIIPAGTIFGAYLTEPDSFVLMGCMVNPGFDFTDFKLMDRKHLLDKFPEQKQIIEKLT